MSNILFVCPNPIWGGAATATLEIAKMLQNHGHQIIFNDEYNKKDEINGLAIDHTSIHRKRFSDRKSLHKIIAKHNIDCVIWSQLVAIYFLKDIITLKKKGIKQISIVHSLSLKDNLKGKIMDYLVSFALAQMSTIVFVSNYTKESWNKYRAIKKSKAQQVVIHNIVNIEKTTHQINKERPRIGFVGRLSEEKQPEIFCELSVNSQYDFLVYGEGPMLEDLISKYPYVKFKGLCNDINEIYANIDVLVMTSKFENCPMVILEAQAFGIPCVAPNVGGIPEIVDNRINGILYENYNISKIGLAVNNIIAEYSKFSKNSLEYSEINTNSMAMKIWKKILN